MTATNGRTRPAASPEDPAPSRSTALLELSTLAPVRPFIVIDDTRYDFALIEDFGLVEAAQLLHVQEEIAGIGEVEDDDVAAARHVAELIMTTAKKVLRAPDEILEKLTDWDRLRIVEVFGTTVQSPSTAPTLNRAARRRTGAKSSRASARSTAPTTGS